MEVATKKPDLPKKEVEEVQDDSEAPDDSGDVSNSDESDNTDESNRELFIQELAVMIIERARKQLIMDQPNAVVQLVNWLDHWLV